MFNAQEHGYLVKPLFSYNGILIQLPRFGQYLNTREEVFIADAVYATDWERSKFVDMNFYNSRSVYRTQFARCYVQYKNANDGEPLLGKLIIGCREFAMKLEFIGNDLCVLCPVDFPVKRAEARIRKVIRVPRYQLA